MSPGRTAGKHRDWYKVSVDTLRGWGIFVLMLVVAGTGYVGFRVWERYAIQREAARAIDDARSFAEEIATALDVQTSRERASDERRAIVGEDRGEAWDYHGRDDDDGGAASDRQEQLVGQRLPDPAHQVCLLFEVCGDLVERGAEFAEGWNFGPADGDAQPVRRVVEKVVQLWGPPARYEIDAGTHPHEAHLLKLDCAKARARLGWRPRLSLDDALAWTVAWHRAHVGRRSAREATEHQIAQYEALAG